MICKNKHIQFRGKYCRKCGSVIFSAITKDGIRSCISWLVVVVIIFGCIWLATHTISCVSGMIKEENQRREKVEIEFRKNNPQEWVALFNQLRLIRSELMLQTAIKSFVASHGKNDCTFSVMSRIMDIFRFDSDKIAAYDILFPKLDTELTPEQKTSIVNKFVTDENKNIIIKKIYENDTKK